MSPPVTKSCGKCKQLIKERAILSCVSCKLHFHIECKGYEKRYYLLDADRKAQWQCDSCIRKNYKAKNLRAPTSPVLQTPAPKPSSSTKQKQAVHTFEDNHAKSITPDTPASVTFEDDEVIDPFQNVTKRQASHKHTRACSDGDLSLKEETALEITSALKEYIAVQMSSFTQQLFAKIDVLASSMQSFTVRCDNIEQKVAALERRLDEKVDKKVSDLTDTVECLKSELNVREQELLMGEVEITGIPEANGENPVHLATLIANKLGVKISESDVVSAVRVGGARREFAASARDTSARRAPLPPAPALAPAAKEETGPRLLVVRLLRRAQRDELLRAARVRRGADSAGLGLPGPTRRFYVNERLTRVNRLLFRQTREEARRLEWKFAWTRDGAILVRREHGETAKRIRTEDDILKVFGAKPVSV